MSLYGASASRFYNGFGQGRRLFEDQQTVEREYYRKTGIFQPLHIIAIRRDVMNANRGRAIAVESVLPRRQKENL